MKKVIYGFNALLLGAIIILFFTGCETDYPPSLYDPDDQGKPNPIIISVEPAEGVYAGIDTITITGENFSPVIEENFVYFDGNKPVILSASVTELIVQAPVIKGDSLKIQVAVPGAHLFAEYYPYKIEFAAIEYGGIDEYSDAYGIACDTLENLYVSFGPEGPDKIVKITTGEEEIDYVPDAGGSYKAMKMGPGGYLYAARTKWIYQAPPDGGLIEKFTVRLPQSVNDLDFDLYGNIFVAAKKAIFYVKRDDASHETAANYDDPSIILNSIRIFNGYVYVAGYYTGSDTTVVQKGIWRNEITSPDGDLGPTELVFDWGLYVGESGPNILAITFSEDGDMYIGAEDGNAITVLHPDGDAEPLFPTILFPPATVFCWGNDQYLYVNRKSATPSEQRLIRITMGKNGAPYYGRH